MPFQAPRKLDKELCQGTLAKRKGNAVSARRMSSSGEFLN
jgi:hypothetical protein